MTIIGSHLIIILACKNNIIKSDFLDADDNCILQGRILFDRNMSTARSVVSTFLQISGHPKIRNLKNKITFSFTPKN